MMREVTMPYVQRLIADEQFLAQLASIREAEKDRIYCHHDMEHLLSVARIAYLLAKEQQTGVEKELIYITALLHDIGRGMQYRAGVSHEQASVLLAREMLGRIGYPKEKTAQVLAVVLEHRGGARGDGQLLADGTDALGALLRQADHLSRNCFCCAAQDTCNWDSERRNATVYL